MKCDLDVHENVLRKWVKEYGADPTQAFPLKAELDILKKAAAYFAKDAMTFASIAKHRSIWPVAWLCAALDVSRSGFHAWLNRSPGQHARHNQVLLVRESFKSSDRTSMVPGVSGTTSLPKASPAASIASNA